MEREKRLVTLSMVVLFFSLVVVYSLFYQVKGATVFWVLRSIPVAWSKTSLEEKRTQVDPSSTGTYTLWDTTMATTWNWYVLDNGKKQFQENRFIEEWDTFSDISAWDDANQAVTNYGGFQNASPGTSSFVGGNSPIILSGTDLYFWAVDSIELLGLEPEYILKDYKGFYYSKFAKEPFLRTTVQKLWGNIYEITSDAELVKNELFGDKVSFINLPDYKNKLVLMWLTVNGQYRLIQMSYDKYHHAKEYLKNLFL
jgi:hypothetical protein